MAGIMDSINKAVSKAVDGAKDIFDKAKPGIDEALDKVTDGAKDLIEKARPGVEEAFGKVASSSFQRYVSMRDVQQLRWYLNRDAELYYFFFQKDGKKSLIVFEPSEDMVRLVRQYLPHGVEQG